MLEKIIVWARGLIFSLIGLGNWLVPKKRQLLLHAYPDVDDQMVAILRWLSTNRWTGPVVFVVSGNPDQVRKTLEGLVGRYIDVLRIYNKAKPVAIWAFWRSSHVVFTHGMYDIKRAPLSQCVINVWHGMPIKAIWKPLNGSNAPGCSWLISTSPKFEEILSKISGQPNTSIANTGLPRNDLLFKTTHSAKILAAELRTGAQRVILFLPTYRQSTIGFVRLDGSETDGPLAMGPEDAARLTEMLVSTGTRLLIKPHPMSVHYGRVDQTHSNLWVISDQWLHANGVTLYDMLGGMDAVVTDVSSVAIDLLALRKPTFFYFPDIALYRANRAFLLEPLNDWLPGPLCTSAAELINVLRKFISGVDDHHSRRQYLAEILNPQIGPSATGKVLSLLDGQPAAELS